MQAISDQPIRNNSSSAARVTARVLECLAKAPSWDCNFTFKHYMVSLGWESSVWGACMQSSQYHLPHVVSSLMPHHTISDVSYHVISDVCRCLLISRRFRWAMHQLPRQLNDGIVASKRCASCLGSSTILSMLRNDCWINCTTVVSFYCTTVVIPLQCSSTGH